MHGFVLQQSSSSPSSLLLVVPPAADTPKWLTASREGSRLVDVAAGLATTAATRIPQLLLMLPLLLLLATVAAAALCVDVFCPCVVGGGVAAEWPGSSPPLPTPPCQEAFADSAAGPLDPAPPFGSPCSFNSSL